MSKDQDEDQENKSNIDGIKKTIENIIQSPTNLEKKRKTAEDIERDNFRHIITRLEKVWTRSALTESLQINLLRYDNEFYDIIDDLILLQYGEKASKLINYFIYNRNTGGTENLEFMQDIEGNPITINSVDDLWVLIQVMNEADLKGKKKKKPKNET